MNKPNSDPFKEAKLKQLKMWFYLIPFIGILPAFWTLYTEQGTSAEKSASRLSINLGLTWLIIYSLLWLGSFSASEIITFRLLFLNSILTSGYFLASFFLMLQVWQGKQPRFSGIENIKLPLKNKRK